MQFTVVGEDTAGVGTVRAVQVAGEGIDRAIEEGTVQAIGVGTDQAIEEGTVQAVQVAREGTARVVKGDIVLATVGEGTVRVDLEVADHIAVVVGHTATAEVGIAQADPVGAVHTTEGDTNQAVGEGIIQAAVAAEEGIIQAVAGVGTDQVVAGIAAEVAAVGIVAEVVVVG